MELARLFVRYGADPSQISFLHTFFTQAEKDMSTEYLRFLVKELNVDVNEEDSEGKDAIAHCYLSMRVDLLSLLAKELGANLELATMP